jgi:hypothetical protein
LPTIAYGISCFLVVNLNRRGDGMREFVGYCDGCRKKIFCMDGFLNGFWDGEKLHCFDCKKEARSNLEEKE